MNSRIPSSSVILNVFQSLLTGGCSEFSCIFSNINFRIYDIMVRFAKWRHGDNILEGGFVVGEK